MLFAGQIDNKYWILKEQNVQWHRHVSRLLHTKCSQTATNTINLSTPLVAFDRSNHYLIIKMLHLTLRFKLARSFFNKSIFKYHIRLHISMINYELHVQAHWETSTKIISDHCHEGHPKKENYFWQMWEMPCNLMLTAWKTVCGLQQGIKEYWYKKENNVIAENIVISWFLVLSLVSETINCYHNHPRSPTAPVVIQIKYFISIDCHTVPSATVWVWIPKLGYEAKPITRVLGSWDPSK